MDPTTLRLIQGAAGAAEAATYVDDVFSTFFYEGNNSTLNIANGIDLSNEGGLVWLKRRSATSNHALWDTERGVQKGLSTNNNSPESDATGSSGYGLTAFNSDGFTLGSSWMGENISGDYCSWTFRKAPGFFDVVTYTGNGSNRAIAHNLGSKPGFMIIKSLDSSSYWRTYNQARGATKSIVLDENFAENTYSLIFNDTEPTATHFTVGTEDSVNKSGDRFVAYLFGHNDQSFGTNSDEAIIKCGEATWTIFQDLGFEPQWLLLRSIGSDNWYIYDTMRGLPVDGSTPYLTPNLTDAENTLGSNQATITSQGFIQNIAPTCTYVAIRRPNKPPTTGTDVFNAVADAGSSSARTITAGNLVDLQISKSRNATYVWYWLDRLRGAVYVSSSGSSAESSSQVGSTTFDVMDGMSVAAADGFTNASPFGGPYIRYFLTRAPGFFDVVPYTGNSSARNITHNLEATPELVIVKSRSLGESWIVNSTHFTTQTSQYVNLNTTSALLSVSNFFATPSSTTFGFGSGAPSEGQINRSGETYIAYLFATLAGISKVGTYSGTGSDVDVDCGFSAGARFILIKRTDSTGDWYTYDSVRGITSGNDPYSLVNDNAVEVTGTDYIDPLNSGFTVTSSAPAGMNASGGTYLFLAIA